MKHKMLLVLLIFFSIPFLSHNTSAQSYAKQYGTGAWIDVQTFETPLLDLIFNLTSDQYCLIEATGIANLDTPIELYLWMKVDNDSADWGRSIRIILFSISDTIYIPFHTSLMKHLFKGSHTVQLWGQIVGPGDADINYHAITVTCNRQGHIEVVH